MSLNFSNIYSSSRKLGWKLTSKPEKGAVTAFLDFFLFGLQFRALSQSNSTDRLFVYPTYYPLFVLCTGRVPASGQRHTRAAFHFTSAFEHISFNTMRGAGIPVTLSGPGRFVLLSSLSLHGTSLPCMGWMQASGKRQGLSADQLL